MTKELQEAQERIRISQAEALDRWRPRSRATFSTRETFKALEAALSKAKAAADGAQFRVESLAKDDTMAREGRDRLIREAVANGRAQVAKFQRAADAALTILKAETSEAALPKINRDREALARDELRLRVEGSVDPVHTMLMLAQEPDSELAACAASSYGESLLRAKGIPNAREAAQTVRNVAAAAAVESVDPERRSVGRAAADIAALDDAAACTYSITRTSLEAAESAALAAGVVGVEG